MDSEPGPAEREALDDGAPLIEPLDGSPHKPDVNRWLIIWRVAALLVLLALLVVGAANVLPHPAGKSASVFRPAPTPTPVVPDGWVRRGPSDASAIAFGQSPSTLAYACGPDSSLPHGINLYSSADGSNTWHQLSFHIAGLPNDGVHGFFGISCMLSVDPADAKDVALLIGYQACGQGLASAVYRSRDGGATWQQMTLPAWDSSGEQAQAAYEFAWVGSTLYVAALQPCGMPLNRVAVSTNGDAFRWVNDDALFTGAPSDATLGPFTPVAPDLYVRLDSRASCPPTCSVYKRSGDGGRTWTPFTATWQGQQLDVLDGFDVGGVDSLYAQYYPDNQDPCTITRTYYRSTDEGATWATLPPLYEGMFIQQAFAAPDGTLYANASSICPGSSVLRGVYRHGAGDVGWAQIASMPGGSPITLSWDEAGHPTGLWATPSSPRQAPILVYHSP